MLVRGDVENSRQSERLGHCNLPFSSQFIDERRPRGSTLTGYSQCLSVCSVLLMVCGFSMGCKTLSKKRGELKAIKLWMRMPGGPPVEIPGNLPEPKTLLCSACSSASSIF